MLKTTIILRSADAAELGQVTTMGRVQVKDLPRVVGHLYAIACERDVIAPLRIANLKRVDDGRYRARLAGVDLNLEIIQSMEWGRFITVL